jgi:uncharacterized protein YndB with AHSA1/START domain
MARRAGGSVPRMAAPVIERTIYIEGSFDAVWTAITDAEWHEDWNLSPCLSFGHRKGAACEWGEPGAPRITGTVQTFRPSQGEVTHSFVFAFRDEPESLVEWQVEDVGRVVAVRLRHHLGTSDPEMQEVVAQSWTVALSRLKTLVETGKPMSLPAAGT